ncbi:hypothetical protein [Serratia fonticola]
MLDLLNNKYFIAIGIPILLVFCGAIIKKLVRSSGWSKKDFYFGNELILTTVGASLLNIYDLRNILAGQSAEYREKILSQMTVTAGFIFIAFFALLLLTSWHQDWENRTGNADGQFVRLGVISNLLGGFMFASFVLWVKGV